MSTGQPPNDDLTAQYAQRAAQGDEAAFTALVEATHHDLRCYVAAHAWDAMMIDEVVQNAYITCFSALSSYRVGAPPLPWLKGMAHNHLLQAKKKQRRHQGRHKPEALLDLIEQPLPVSEHPRAADLRACLERLTPQARAMIDAFYVEGCSLIDVAKRTRRTRGAVAVALSRLRALLRDCLVAKA